MSETRCGFVAIIGAPNAGKSTLINALVGEKVSIVTRKAQTTRSTVRGVLTRGEAQIVFVDTPGLFAPKRRLDRAMVASAWSAAADADVLALLIDGSAAGQRSQREQAQRRHKRLAPTETIAGPAAQHQEPGEHDRVGIYDPLQIDRRETEAVLYRRQGDINDRQVEDHHELRDAADHKQPGLAGAR